MNQIDVEIQDSYRRAIREILPLCTTILAPLYFMYAVSNYLVLPPGLSRVMVPVAGLIALFYFVMAILHRYGRRRPHFFLSRVNPHLLMFIYGLVLILDASIHISRSHEAVQTTDFMIIQIGVASVVLHPLSFILLNSAILSSWILIFQTSVHDREWIHFGLALVSTTALSIIIFFFRRDSIRRLEIRRLNDLKHQRELIHTSKMVALGEMATGIAHEINNPLTIIMGKATHLKDLAIAGKLKSQEKLVGDLIKIEMTVMRISKIIKGLRSFARNTEADPKQKACLNHILDETLSLCQERLRTDDINLSISEFHDVFIYCRPAEISQVLLNLIQNSMDAIEKLEPIQKWIRIEIKEFSNQVRIQVIDGGKGIDPEVQEKMMQPFFTTKEVGQGTGLGLSISRGIIEEHRGNLRYLAESLNTTFEIGLEKI